MTKQYKIRDCRYDHKTHKTLVAAQVQGQFPISINIKFFNMQVWSTSLAYSLKYDSQGKKLFPFFTALNNEFLSILLSSSKSSSNRSVFKWMSLTKKTWPIYYFFANFLYHLFIWDSVVSVWQKN